MHYETTYKLEDFVLNTKWEDLPAEVQERLKGCLVDLMGALVVGSRSEQFKVGLKVAESLFHRGEREIPVIGSEEKFNMFGAATAMGHSSNAYDIDDGHNMTRAHPGTSFIGAVLAAAYEKNLSRNELLAVMDVAYEVTIRGGAAMMEYYQWAHSSGTFGALGVAAGVGRIYGFTKEELNNVLSIADFNAPLVPGIRSVEYPSMNKDGVPFGVMIGLLALQASMCGFEGNKNLMESDDHKHFLDDLGTKHQVMDLYFKPYTCCRWGHPAIDACLEIMNGYNLTPEDIEKATVYTFEKATMLSKIVPKEVDEAQYNIAYPVAAALIYGDFGWAQVRKESLGDPAVVEMMKKLHFEIDPEFDRQFPAKRYCRAEIVTKDGRTLVSSDCEPRGEAHENIGVDWLADKFRRITGPVLTSEGQEKILAMICGEENVDVRAIVDEVNKKEYWKDI